MMVDTKRVKYVLFSVGLGVLTLNFGLNALSVFNKSKRLTQLEAEVKALEDKRTALEKELKFRESGEFVEQEARNKLGLVKPGEELYLKPKIVGDVNGVSTVIDEIVAETPKPRGGILGLFDKLKSFLLRSDSSEQE